MVVKIRHGVLHAEGDIVFHQLLDQQTRPQIRPVQDCDIGPGISGSGVIRDLVDDLQRLLLRILPDSRNHRLSPALLRDDLLRKTRFIMGNQLTRRIHDVLRTAEIDI